MVRPETVQGGPGAFCAGHGAVVLCQPETIRWLTYRLLAVNTVRAMCKTSMFKQRKEVWLLAQSAVPERSIVPAKPTSHATAGSAFSAYPHGYTNPARSFTGGLRPTRNRSLTMVSASNTLTRVLVVTLDPAHEVAD